MRKGLYSRLFSLFFVTWAVYSIVFSQVIPFLHSVGYNESQISWMLTASALIGMMTQLLIGYWLDKYQKTKVFFVMLTIVIALLSSIAYSVTQMSFWLLFFIVSIFVALFRVSSNVAETWVYQIDNDVMSRFGIIRIFGSIGWAIASIFVAWVIERYNYFAIMPMVLVLTVIILFFCVGIPDSEKVSSATSLNFKDINILLNNKQYVLGLWFFFILFMIYNFDGITGIYKMIELGSSNSLIGFKWFAQAIVEIPLMALGAKLIVKLSNRNVSLLTAIFMGLRFILYGLATTPEQMVWISLLQAFTFPTMLLAQKDYVAKTVPIELRSSGHMIMTAITSNIPVILVPLISNMVSGFASNSQILLVSGILCIVPIFLLKDVKI